MNVRGAGARTLVMASALAVAPAADAPAPRRARCDNEPVARAYRNNRRRLKAGAPPWSDDAPK